MLIRSLKFCKSLHHVMQLVLWIVIWGCFECNKILNQLQETMDPLKCVVDPEEDEVFTGPLTEKEQLRIMSLNSVNDTQRALDDSENTNSYLENYSASIGNSDDVKYSLSENYSPCSSMNSQESKKGEASSLQETKMVESNELLKSLISEEDSRNYVVPNTSMASVNDAELNSESVNGAAIDNCDLHLNLSSTSEANDDSKLRDANLNTSTSCLGSDDAEIMTWETDGASADNEYYDEIEAILNFQALNFNELDERSQSKDKGISFLETNAVPAEDEIAKKHAEEEISLKTPSKSPSCNQKSVVKDKEQRSYGSSFKEKNKLAKMKVVKPKEIVSSYQKHVKTKNGMFNVNKKWNVQSPVAKYIKDSPLPPFIKTVVAKDCKRYKKKKFDLVHSSASSKTSQRKSNKENICSTSKIPAPAVHAVGMDSLSSDVDLKPILPVSEYKIRKSTKEAVTKWDMLTEKNTLENLRIKQYFSSPKVIRHHGASKVIKWADHLEVEDDDDKRISETNKRSVSMDQSLNLTTMDMKMSAKTNTLGKGVVKHN